MTALKLVVFDCDGTLHNSVGGVEQGLQYALSINGITGIDVSGVGRMLARPLYMVVPHLLNVSADDAIVGQVLDAYDTYMDNDGHPRQMGSLYTDIETMLSQLYAHGSVSYTHLTLPTTVIV